MAGFIFPDANQLTMVGLLKTPYATGLLKLFKSPIAFTPDIDATALSAIEADFTGYAAITLTTLPAQFLDPVNGGVSFQIPTQQWDCSSPLTVANSIYGGWIETSANVLLMAWQISSPWVMDAPHKSLPLDVLLNFFGTNQVYIDINGVPQ